MAKRPSSPNTHIPVANILTVSRQPPIKRLPSDAENIDNAFVTLERNIEKRSGFEVVPQTYAPHMLASTDENYGVWDFVNNVYTKLNLYPLDNVGDHDLWYYWYSINEDNRFLLVVDFDAVTKDANLFYSFHIAENGTWDNITSNTQWGAEDPTIQHSTAGNENNSTVVQAYSLATVGNAGVTQAGTNATNIKLAAAASTVDDFYNGATLTISGVSKLITDYVGSTNVATVGSAFASYAAGQTYSVSLTYAQAVAAGTIHRDTRNYITHNTASKTARDSLRAVTLGSSVVVLNKNVSAGFSSDRVSGSTGSKLFDLDGVETSVDDLKGKRIVYYTASRVTEVFNVGEDEIQNTEDDISLGFKIDAAVTGVAHSRPNSTSLKLQDSVPVHASILKSGSTTKFLALSGTASTVDGEYVGMDITINNASGVSGLSGRITQYTGSTRIAEVQDISVISSGVLSAGSTTTVIQTGAHGIHLLSVVGAYLVIAGEYRLISSATTIALTTATAFSGTASEHLNEGGEWEIVRHFKDVINTTNTTNGVINLGANAHVSDNHYKGRWITILGQVRQILSYIGSTKLATLSTTLTSVPPVNTQYYIDHGVGFGGTQVGALSGVVSNYYIYLDKSSHATSTTYVGYKIQIHPTGTVSDITSHYGAVDNGWYVYFNSSSAPSPASVANSIVNITAPSSRGYSISSLYPDDDIYNGYNVDVTTTAAGVTTTQTRTITSYSQFTNTITVSTAWTDPQPAAGSTYKITGGVSNYIPAGDYSYYLTEFSHLGQQVADISTIRLPPENYDWYANNSNLDPNNTNVEARLMLAALYDTDHPHKEVVNGRGKIYLTTGPYLNLTAGYYRVIDFVEGEDYTLVGGDDSGVIVTGSGRPYLQKVRTPDEWSYIDPRRMPQRFSFDISSGDYVWSGAPIEWTPRDSGDNTTNPGPSIFRSINGRYLKHPKLTALAVFKNRLWFGADDVVFSSRVGDYENMFIDDPTNMVDTDPIDLRASSNSFAEIVTMTPFEDYMFVNTKADTQFQLQSSTQNQGVDLSLTPFNVVLSPASYYAAAAVIEPQLLGSQLYFFDKRRMYLFTGKTQMGFNSAVEISSSIKDYLPENYGVACVASAHNTVVLTDADHPNHIYLYTIRFSGDRVIQSSFYRFILEEDAEVKAIQAYGNYLYVVLYKEEEKFYLQRLLLQEAQLTTPRIDNMFLIKTKTDGTDPNTTYDALLNETTIKVPDSNLYNITEDAFTTAIYAVLGSGWTSSSSSTFTASLSTQVMNVTENLNQDIVVGSVISGSGVVEGTTVTAFGSGTGGIGSYSVTSTNTVASSTLTNTVTEDISGTVFESFKGTVSAGAMHLVLLGKFDQNNKDVYLGTTFTTTVELSPLFVRDQDGTPYFHGALSIRSARIEHHNTGNYDVVVSNRGRTSITTSFAAPRVDFTSGEDTLALNNIEYSGKFIVKIFGYNNATSIKLVSSYITPMNIANMGFMGRLTQRNTLI